MQTGNAMKTSTTCSDDEDWICCHTRKCGWRGKHDELVQVRDHSSAVARALRRSVGTCPKCGHDKFYVRKPKSQTLAN